MNWELLATDEVSGRQIFKLDAPVDPMFRQLNGGTYDFQAQADFEVRDKSGQVLLTTSGRSSGEYWCGVFLWFVENSNGKQVRLEETDSGEHEIINVPDFPLKKG